MTAGLAATWPNNIAAKNHAALTADELSLAGRQGVRDHALLDMMEALLLPPEVDNILEVFSPLTFVSVSCVHSCQPC